MKDIRGIILNVFRYLSGRVVILYVAAFVFTFFFLSHQDAKQHAQLGAISRLQPRYYYLRGFSDGKVPFDRKELKSYRLFFTQLLEVLPDRPDGYGMLGFCHYHLGDTDKAVAAYTKAADAVPSFLWFNYNLGLLHFQKKDYEQAVKYLERAVVSDPQVIFRFIASSKVYLDAVAVVPDFQAEYPERLRTSWRDSYKILVLSYFYLQQYDRMFAAADLAANQKLDDDGFFYYYLGVGAYYAGQLDKAIAFLQQALHKNPDAAENYYYLALTLKAMNKEDMAAAALNKAQDVGRTKGASYSDLKGIRLRIF